MAPKFKTPLRTAQNMILLWLSIHGGDPGPDDIKRPLSQISLATALHEIANHLTDVEARKQIQAVAANLIAKNAGQLGGR